MIGFKAHANRTDYRFAHRRTRSLLQSDRCPAGTRAPSWPRTSETLGRTAQLRAAKPTSKKRQISAAARKAMGDAARRRWRRPTRHRHASSRKARGVKLLSTLHSNSSRRPSYWLCFGLRILVRPSFAGICAFTRAAAPLQSRKPSVTNCRHDGITALRLTRRAAMQRRGPTRVDLVVA